MHMAGNASTSISRDTLKREWAARREIPFQTNWKQQQLVMQSISQGWSLQLPTFPQSQGKARRKPDHPFQPTRKPAVPGTIWEAVSMEFFPPGSSSSPAGKACYTSLGHSKIWQITELSTIPTVINEKVGESLEIQDAKTYPSAAND